MLARQASHLLKRIKPVPFLLAEAQPTPDVYQGEVMDMLKEFTKNRNQEQRLDAPSLEYLEKEHQ